MKNFKIDPEFYEIPKTTIFPHTVGPVITETKNELKLEMMNYSLVPSWSQTRKPKFTTYNARIEDIEFKPTWKGPFAKNHCLVPLSYFIESCHFGEFEGHLIRISYPEVIHAAGIFDEWYDPEKQTKLRSFAIITTEPTSQLLAAGHDRSPLFLSPDSCLDWLKPVREPKKFLSENAKAYQFDIQIESKLKSYKASSKN